MNLIPDIAFIFAIFNKLRFFLFTPPKATILILVILESKLNLTIPNDFLYLLLLKMGEINNNSTPCFSFILISSILCADPITKKSFFFCKNL